LMVVSKVAIPHPPPGDGHGVFADKMKGTPLDKRKGVVYLWL
jgi:hypothetical protein